MTVRGGHSLSAAVVVRFIFENQSSRKRQEIPLYTRLIDVQ